MTTTDALAELVVTTEYANLPEDVRSLARLCLRDHLGVGLLGSQSESGNRIRQYVTDFHAGDTATVLGGGRTTPQGAALANGTFAHVDDYDDTYDSIVIHPSTPVVPAALAAAEDAKATAQELLTAIVVGAEVVFRVGHAVYPEHYDNGWHLTATVGTFGAAAAAASIYGFSKTEVKHAFGIAGSAAPTTLKRNMGTTIKLTHPGQGAQRGIEAAIMARNGWEGNQAIFDGDNSYPAVMAPGREDPTVSVSDLGESWSLSDVGFKLYPSAIVTHAGIYAFESLLEEENVGPDEIESVTVVVDESIDVLKHPPFETPFEAKFSFEFCLSLVAERNGVEPAYFSNPILTDPEIKRRMESINVVREASLFGAEYFGYGSRVQVETIGGDSLVRKVRTPPAMPYSPDVDDALEKKFLKCATVALEEDTAHRFNEILITLGENYTLTDLLDKLRY